MALFGIGASLPLLLIGTAGRQVLGRMRGRLALAGRTGKAVLGTGMLGAGVLVISGLDKGLEQWMLDHGPAGLVELSTRF